MENLGNTIIENRKKLNLTQKDLGDMLNVTSQAVSKWENGQSEPDTSTIRKLCEIFKISTDELLGIPPSAGAPAPAPEPVRERVVEQKIINGYCETCKKPLGPGEYVVESSRGGAQHIYCHECKKKAEKAARVGEYREQKRATAKSFIWGSVAGVAALVGILIALLLDGEFSTGESVGISIFCGVALFTFVTQMFWEGFIVDMFFFFLKSFRMPGVIFTLDLDGLIFLILVKVFGAILSVLLSVVFFLIGLIITPVVSVVIFPFAAIKRVAETKSLKRSALI